MTWALYHIAPHLQKGSTKEECFKAELGYENLTYTQVSVAMPYIVQISHNVLLGLTIETGYSENEKAISVSHALKDIINFKLSF